MKIYSAINKVQADLCATGLSKTSTNTFDNYKFRGIDAVYNALSPLLAKHGLCILPRMLTRTCEERTSQKGGALFYVNVDAEFDFVAVEDGSKHTIKTYGEAMDRGDKATNKAMSAAYKYAAFLAFAIPTEGDNDADSASHDVAPKDAPPVQKSAPKIINPPTKTDSYSIEDGRAFELFTAAKAAVEQHENGDDKAAFEEISGISENGEKLFLWAILKEYSALRAMIKKAWAAKE